jgi:hypothetical protein
VPSDCDICKYNHYPAYCQDPINCERGQPDYDPRREALYSSLRDTIVIFGVCLFVGTLIFVLIK